MSEHDAEQPAEQTGDYPPAEGDDAIDTQAPPADMPAEPSEGEEPVDEQAAEDAPA
jgi:hypothetical protein